jgi:2-oxoglutarate ferredoxin oxidoreductase subunit beta
MSLNTYAENTWCPGCGNFGILLSIKNAISDLISEGMPKEKFVMVSGIGCNSKIVDYVNVNSFYSIHGRVLPTLTGIKLANRNLIPIGFAGDGEFVG